MIRKELKPLTAGKNHSNSVAPLNALTYKSDSKLTVALFPWGNVIEDFLNSINLSLDEFCTEMTGGWLFGYIEALKSAGVSTVLVCVSSTLSAPSRRIHTPTGAVMWFLPATSAYLAIHRQMVNPYGWTTEETFGSRLGIRRPWFTGLREIAPYLATPLNQVADVLKAEHCQAILCQEYEYQRFDLCVWLGKRLNIPVYASFQGGNFQLTKLEKLWRTWSIRASHGVIVATTSEIKRLRQHYRLPDKKIAQIFNPLDTSVWDESDKKCDRTIARTELSISPAAQVVVWHGRVEIYRKGLDILIEAWQQVCEQNSDHDLHLLLVGTGSDAAALRHKIEQTQLTNIHRVDEYILDRQRICRYLKAADIYVLPSRHEGFPVAPLEAMACGLPVVAANVPGIPDILEEGEASGGIRVPAENPTQLASALRYLLDDPDLCQTLGRHARQTIEANFSITAVGQAIRHFIFPDS